jgi:chromate transporter
VFLAGHPPEWIIGAAAGAGACVPVVALNAARGFAASSRPGRAGGRWLRARWVSYVLLGGAAAATVGSYLVLVLLACGLAEVAVRALARPTGPAPASSLVAVLVGHLPAAGGLLALLWVALKVGALSYGGGFVIVPLMQHDAVSTYHWMTSAQFLNAVALGQVTPGPVVQTVAVVGYAQGGVLGGLCASAVAFAPSFLFVLFGGPRFDRLRANLSVQHFFRGAGPAVVGAIAGSAIPLSLALGHVWQLGVTALAAIWLLVLRRGVVAAILGAGGLGVVAALAGAPLAH